MEKVDSDLVKKAPTSGEERPPNVGRINATHTDVVSKRTDSETWLVDNIEAHREQRNGSVECLIRWNGLFHPTWGPRENILEDLISSYLAR